MGESNQEAADVSKALTIASDTQILNKFGSRQQEELSHTSQLLGAHVRTEYSTR